MKSVSIVIECISDQNPVDTARKLNVHNLCSIYVLCLWGMTPINAVIVWIKELDNWNKECRQTKVNKL